VKDAYDRGQVVSLDSFDDPHLAAVLLKKYIRDLPEPLFSEVLYPVIQQCPVPTEDPSDWSAILYIRESLFSALPGCNYILLSYILRTSYFRLIETIWTHGSRLDARSVIALIDEFDGRT
jgi:Rho GTPase-activating protein 1